MRRRHGIPDNDHRPFNVAYAAAKQAQKERETERTGKARCRDVNAPSALRREEGSIPIESTRPRPATGMPITSLLLSYLKTNTSVVLSGRPLQRRNTEESAGHYNNYVDSRRTSGQTTTASESDYRQ